MDKIRKFIISDTPRKTMPSLLLLIARISFGLLFLSHGVAKWMAIEELSFTFPDPLGVGVTLSLSLVIFAEVFCSIGVILGALYRLCLIPMIFTMCIAFFVIHRSDAFAAKELALIYLIIFVLLFIAGPGRFSVDAMINRKIKNA